MNRSIPAFAANQLPCIQRLLTFLFRSGLYFYGLRLSSWSEYRSLLVPFTLSSFRFEASDEAYLAQLEQASLDDTIQVGMVYAFDNKLRLEIEQRYYRLRYSQMETGRQRLIHELLVRKGIVVYVLTEELNEGRNLPHHPRFGDIENCSGTVVTPTTAYSFWLDWIDGRYSLGEERSYYSRGQKHYFWREYTPEQILQGKRFKLEVKGARQLLHLRKPYRLVESSEIVEIWEICEENTIQ